MNTSLSILDSMMDTVSHFDTKNHFDTINTTKVEEVTTKNVTLMLEEEPGLAASSGLYGEFLQAWKKHASEHQVFQLLSQYEQLCKEQFHLLRSLIKRTAPGQAKYSGLVEMVEELEQEMTTWQLLESLYKDRLITEANADDEDMIVDQIGKYQSDKTVVDSLYTRDPNVRQSQLVVDWLEKAAEIRLDDVYDKVEFHTDQAGSWEHTLHVLKRKGGLLIENERPMIDKMDPDAPIRQRRPLADLDKEDEARLLKYIFLCVRAGKLEHAETLCNKCGQAWRAATLEGWRLYDDPNYHSLGPGGEVQRSEGNPYRDVWKSVCWRMSQEEAFSAEERAIYATFSGNLKHLLPVCTKWQDYVWAYFRVMIDARVEQEIRLCLTKDRSLEPLPPSYFDKMMTAESIFLDIEACPNEDIRSTAKGHYPTIQKYIILGDIDGLIEETYDRITKSSGVPQHFIRFVAHLILFFRTVGVSTKEELCVAILECYVKYLIESKQTELVAAYTATLTQNLQVEWFARFLQGVQDTDDRKHCLVLAEEANLNVSMITKRVVEIIQTSDTVDFSMTLEAQFDNTVSEDDEEKINAIEWLVFNPAQRSEAIRQANAVMRNFLALKKQNAARAVFKKIPVGSIDVVVQIWHMKTGSTELSAADDNSIREYLCIQAYLDAIDSFNDWFEHYHHSRPSEPRCPLGSNFTERVAFEHQEKQYEAELQRWKNVLDVHTKTTTQRLYNVLLFVDGGWMVDQNKEENADLLRREQLMRLRQLCLPNICFLLCTILSQTKQHQECLQLAEIISSEVHQLYLVFRKDELQKLLHKLRESAVELLDQNKGPLGYDLS